VPLKVVPRRDRKLYRLVKRGETRRLRRGEILYRAGEAASDLYLVRAGYLRLTQGEADETRSEAEAPARIVAIAGPWEMAGEEALLPDAPRALTAIAGEPVHLTVLSGSAGQGALQTSQRTLEAFLRAKEEELALARVLAGARRAGGARARLGALLLHLSARHGKAEGKWVRLTLPLTHQLLADLSHSHRSTVTTLLNDWIYAGVLRDEEVGLKILKPEALRGGGR
jgi:CRP/FNR family cyclic AMP-dependent transcriptional regulator